MSWRVSSGACGTVVESTTTVPIGFTFSFGDTTSGADVIEIFPAIAPAAWFSSWLEGMSA